MVEVPIARAKIFGMMLVTPSPESTLTSYLPFTFLRRRSSDPRRCVVDIGLLTIEQTLVHIGHNHELVHGGVLAQLVGHQPAQPFGQARLEIVQ